MNYTVIVPFYNEEKNVSSFNKELINNLNKTSNEKRNLEIIYIDDGSNDKTFEELKKLALSSIFIKCSINFDKSFFGALSTNALSIVI